VIMIASGSLVAGCASSASHFLFERPWIIIVQHENVFFGLMIFPFYYVHSILFGLNLMFLSVFLFLSAADEGGVFWFCELDLRGCVTGGRGCFPPALK